VVIWHEKLERVVFWHFGFEVWYFGTFGFHVWHFGYSLKPEAHAHIKLDGCV
jgi:hypothetical protein